jgi:hypothetical protein
VIAGAALLVLLGLGLFVAGILTGVTVLYWGCVAVCLVAAVLLIAVRRRIGREPSAPAGPTTTPEPAATAPPRKPESDATAADQAPPASVPPAADLPDPEVEEVEVTDLLMVVDLKDEVLVVDEHPRYHLGGCRWLAGRETFPLPLDEARTDGFTPCAWCEPDRTLAQRERGRRSGRSS